MIYSYAPFLFKGDMMKKENIWLIISILLVIIWMVSVFKLSGEVSEVSGNRSGGFISSIIRFFNNDISEDKLEKLRIDNGILDGRIKEAEAEISRLQ